MDIDEFIELINENSKKGRETEFIKLAFSFDDPRKGHGPGLEVDETFSVNFDKNKKVFTVYLPDKDKELILKQDELEDLFYAQRWGSCIHK